MYHLVIGMKKTKVDQLGRTSVPAEIRRLLNINDGDKLVWRQEEGKIIIEKEGEGKNADEVIGWLRENAPECFTEEIQKNGYKIEGLDTWSKRKLGLKE